VCPECKSPVTKFIRHGKVLSDVLQPKTSFSLLMDNHVFGSTGRARRQHVPWRDQPDLDGFVFDEVSLSEQRSFEELDESEFLSGVLREIQRKSRFEWIQAVAFEHAVISGLGGWYIDTEFESARSFDQELEVYSAGTRPAQCTHANAVRVMRDGVEKKT